MLNVSDSVKTYKLTIPTTYFDNAAPKAVIDKVRNTVKKAVASEFGGYTEVQGIGGYAAENGSLIEETVFTVETFYQRENDQLMETLAEMIKTELKQECVLIQKNGIPFFI